MRIALIKTSSMGDVIHALPVVSDIVAALPEAEIDWVVEESFADLPRLHPAVAEIVPVAIRRWRRALARAGREHRLRHCDRSEQRGQRRAHQAGATAHR